MRIIIFLSLISILFSCSLINRARKNIATDEIAINGGVYKDKQWSDKLIFKRTSWYQEASMEYDLMLNKLDASSNFANWLGSDTKYIEECSEFYVALLYADVNARHRVSFLIDKVEKLGMRRVGISTFKENIRAHSNFADWRLSQYKITGFCRNDDSTGDLVITVPGFKSINL